MPADRVSAMAGRSIGSYRLVRAIGQGLLGTVYEAAHEVIGRQVTVQLLEAAFTEPRRSGRVMQDISAQRGLVHPGLVPVLDCGPLGDGGLYILTEGVQGETLRQRLQ